MTDKEKLTKILKKCKKADKIGEMYGAFSAYSC